MSPEIIDGFAQASQVRTILAVASGCFIGLIIGMIPGLTISTGIIIVLPLTFVLEPDISIALLLGLYVSGMTGGSFSAILLNIPGTPSASATALDGHPMAKMGEGGRARLTRGWMGQEKEEIRSYKRMTAIAPAFVIIYAIVMTMLSYDWVMSLEPHWFSTMFGPWFFMGAFWIGIAATALWSVYLRTQHEDFYKHIGLQQRHDIGKLAFAFCVFWTYLFFSQYIVIWYGKLPWEQAWIIRRSDEIWGGLSGLVILLCFVIPFAGLIGRKPKTKPVLLAFFTSIILVGMWLERYVMLAPSLHHGGDPVFTIWQPLIGLMFLGLYLGSVRWFLTTFPAIQVWQPMVDPETREAEIPVGLAAE